jgi:hypothetical protein
VLNAFSVSSGDDDGASIARREKLVEVDGRIVCVVEEQEPGLIQAGEPQSRVRSTWVRYPSLGADIFQGTMNSLFTAGVDEIGLRVSVDTFVSVLRGFYK